MKIKHLLLLAFCLSLFQCGSYEYGTTDDRFEHDFKIDDPDLTSGNCYAKCLMPDVYEVAPDHYEEYIAFTGDPDTEDVDIEVQRIRTREASTKWVKKKADKNCKSADPNDCLVWCLVEVPAEYSTITILPDTTQSSNWEIRKISKPVKTKAGGFTEWRQVVCQDAVTETLVLEIQQTLTDEGYFEKEASGKMDTYTKAAMTKFQKDKNLPVGNLDFETLYYLEIDIYAYGFK